MAYGRLVAAVAGTGQEEKDPGEDGSSGLPTDDARRFFGSRLRFFWDTCCGSECFEENPIVIP